MPPPPPPPPRGQSREMWPGCAQEKVGHRISVTDSEGRSGTGSTHEGPKASGAGHRLGAELYACMRTGQGPLVAGMINYVRQESQPSSDQIRKCPAGYNQHRARIALCERPHLSTRVAAAASATSTAPAASAHRALPGNVPRLAARVASPRHSSRHNQHEKDRAIGSSLFVSFAFGSHTSWGGFLQGKARNLKFHALSNQRAWFCVGSRRMMEYSRDW
jgi:hypothetical protein